MPTATLNDDILVLTGADVHAALDQDEQAIISVIRTAYVAHDAGRSSVPHSVFLRFPDQPQDRIIGLPAYLGGEQPAAGMKWIASFPHNIQEGIDRASATIILNDTTNGRPYAILEGSLISAKRTAASAAFAASLLIGNRRPSLLGVIGCGLINFEVCRFVTSLFPEIRRIAAYDVDAQRARHFVRKVHEELTCDGVIYESIAETLAASSFVSLATTAGTPHIIDPEALKHNPLVLHVSLRDLGPEIIRRAYNVVDDLEHVNREQTSIHLAAQTFGHTDFVYGSIGAIAASKTPPPEDDRPVIVSPFGLGLLDIALARHAHRKAADRGRGFMVPHFFPEQHRKA